MQVQPIPIPGIIPNGPPSTGILFQFQGGSSRYNSVMPACIEYQGAQDRITYHELQAQAKIQTLRIKLFARVRFFDESSETWSMRVVELPTNNTDWWHSRLHFVSKD